MPTKQVIACLYGIAPAGEVVHVSVVTEAGVTYLSDSRGLGYRHPLHPAALNYAHEAERVFQLREIISIPAPQMGTAAAKAAVAALESKADAIRRAGSAPQARSR